MLLKFGALVPLWFLFSFLIVVPTFGRVFPTSWHYEICLLSYWMPSSRLNWMFACRRTLSKFCFIDCYWFSRYFTIRVLIFSDSIFLEPIFYFSNLVMCAWIIRQLLALLFWAGFPWSWSCPRPKGIIPPPIWSYCFLFVGFILIMVLMCWFWVCIQSFLRWCILWVMFFGNWLWFFLWGIYARLL